MNSPLFKLQIPDFARAAINAVLIAVLATIYGVATGAGFDVFTADWAQIGADSVNAAFIAFITLIGNSFLTADNGKLFGRIG